MEEDCRRLFASPPTKMAPPAALELARRGLPLPLPPQIPLRSGPPGALEPDERLRRRPGGGETFSFPLTSDKGPRCGTVCKTSGDLPNGSAFVTGAGLVASASAGTNAGAVERREAGDAASAGGCNVASMQAERSRAWPRMSSASPAASAESVEKAASNRSIFLQAEASAARARSSSACAAFSCSSKPCASERVGSSTESTVH